MNTEKTRITFPIIGGPDREHLIAAFTHYPDASASSVELTLSRDFCGNGDDVLQGSFLKVGIVTKFRPTGLQYEDGSGYSFNVDGYIELEGVSAYVEGYYNSRSKGGMIHIGERAPRKTEFEAHINAAFAAKAKT